MEKLIVLGTGNAQAVHCYNTCFAMQKGEEYFLTDAGGGNGILLALEKKYPICHFPSYLYKPLFLPFCNMNHFLYPTIISHMLMAFGRKTGVMRAYFYYSFQYSSTTLFARLFDSENFSAIFSTTSAKGIPII